MTQAIHPTPGKPLDQDSVKLLLPGDVLRCSFPVFGALLQDQEYVFERPHENDFIDIHLFDVGASWRADRFTFVSRPTSVGEDQEAQPSPAASGWPSRGAVKGALIASMGWPHDLHPGPAADAILALFPTPTQGDNHDQ